MFKSTCYKFTLIFPGSITNFGSIDRRAPRLSGVFPIIHSEWVLVILANSKKLGPVRREWYQIDSSLMELRQNTDFSFVLSIPHVNFNNFILWRWFIQLSHLTSRTVLSIRRNGEWDQILRLAFVKCLSFSLQVNFNSKSCRHKQTGLKVSTISKLISNFIGNVEVSDSPYVLDSEILSWWSCLFIHQWEHLWWSWAFDLS